MPGAMATSPFGNETLFSGRIRERLFGTPTPFRDAFDFWRGDVPSFSVDAEVDAEAEAFGGVGRGPGRDRGFSVPGFEPNRWWETPGIAVGPGGLATVNGEPVLGPGGKTFQPQVPQFFKDAGGGDDPALFLAFANAFPFEENPTVWLNLMSAAESRGREDEARRRAIGTLEGTRREIAEARDLFRSDPGRQQIGETLATRASPAFDAIGEAEQAAAVNEIARRVALAQAHQLAGAASRGTVRSGTTGATLDAVRALGEIGGVQSRAQFERFNREARERALHALTQFEDRSLALENQYLDALARLDEGIAMLEKGVDVEPADFVPFAQLDFARQQYADTLERVDRELALLEEAANPNVLDLFALAPQLSGTGFFENEWQGSIAGVMALLSLLGGPGGLRRGAA